MKALLVALAAVAPLLAAAQQRTNHFDDPFLQVTSAMPGCPVPQGPGYTPQEVREQAHARAQHGTSCYRVGRCRLPNSYLYDREIIPRASQYIRMDGRFDDTSVWILGERRLITLTGCVRSKEQALELERTLVLVDDVMGVVNQLMVGTQGTPAYKTAAP